MSDFFGEPAGYRELIGEALEEYEQKHFEEARALFQQAHDMFPNARTLRGLGMVEFELRNYGDSINYLESALSSDVRPLDPDLRKSTEQLCARARRFVARVALEVEPGAATVIVDGVPVSVASGGTLVLEVGEHVLEVRADAYVPERRQLVVRGGEAQRLRIVLNPRGTSELVSVPSQSPRHRWTGGLVVSTLGPTKGYALKTPGVGFDANVWLDMQHWAVDARFGARFDIREELRDYVHVPLEIGAYRTLALGEHQLFFGGGAGVAYVHEHVETTNTVGTFLVTRAHIEIDDEGLGLPLFARVGARIYRSHAASLLASVDYVVTFADFADRSNDQAVRASLGVVFGRVRP